MGELISLNLRIGSTRYDRCLRCVDRKQRNRVVLLVPNPRKDLNGDARADCYGTEIDLSDTDATRVRRTDLTYAIQGNATHGGARKNAKKAIGNCTSADDFEAQFKSATTENMIYKQEIASLNKQIDRLMKRNTFL